MPNATGYFPDSGANDLDLAKGKLILAARHKSSVRDERPLAKAGVPEVREYCCAGLIDDEEIGQRSKIVSVTFAG